jgi:hypothetical protein
MTEQEYKQTIEPIAKQVIMEKLGQLNKLKTEIALLAKVILDKDFTNNLLKYLETGDIKGISDNYKNTVVTNKSTPTTEPSTTDAWNERINNIFKE